jgi:signal transduction histidine kinase/ActR/RegA family two-component response regulator
MTLTRTPRRPIEESPLATANVLRDQTLARRRLEERSAELEVALQRATEGDHRKTEFLATLAHELRNQLGPVMSSLEVMQRAPDNAELLERARATIERQVHHMTRLVDDLLDVSRIARDRLEIRKAPVSLGGVLEDSVEANRPALEAAAHTVTIALPPAPVFLEADLVRLTQVFNNLLTNACKYTRPGGRIEVTVERQGSDVVVRVADNGIGIPPSLLERVFEKWVQVDRSVERVHGGLGIGLAVARQLVELHGGSITANSEGLGRGTEFVVRLPILTRQPLVLDPPPAPAPPIHGSTPRMLLVDDNRDSVESLALLLTLTGYEVKTAYDGCEAFEQAAAHRPEVILLDIGLPRMSGYEVCRTIRAEPWGKDMVVIALTGWGRDDDRRRTADAGFSGHLIKPVDYASLMKLLSRVGKSTRHSLETASSARLFAR